MFRAEIRYFEDGTNNGLKGFATRLTVEAYSLAAKAATYAALSHESVFVTAMSKRSTYSISSQLRCSKLVHSLKLTGKVFVSYRLERYHFSHIFPDHTFQDTPK